jgi:glycosyltransferase involved in cell wall biosynthesis
LIGATLDSILNQSYSNWECIVVDDHSTDATIEVMQTYCSLDRRIKFYSRPESKRKGANSCRNYGFQKSSGEYIIWFDSDDLMTIHHLKSKVKAIEESKESDFVVAQTANFEKGKLLKPYSYDKKPYGILASDFILLKIHWYTYDVLLKREVAEQISWNEHMKSWQDYNYFCKMLLVTSKGVYVDEVVTHRRLHSNSIQKSLNRNKRNFSKELLENRVLTFKDIHKCIDINTKKELIFGMMNISFELMRMNILTDEIQCVFQIVRKELGIRSALYFAFSLKISLVLKKGYYFLEKAKRRS